MRFSRRAAIAAFAAMGAGPALAQGKKTSGGSKGGGGGGGGLIGVDGQYRSHGLNADGSAYEGDAWIVQQGDVVEFTWKVEGDTMRGQGVIEGRVVTVDWGADTPVVYVVMPDGTLHGTWDDGLALEKLTPVR